MIFSAVMEYSLKASKDVLATLKDKALKVENERSLHPRVRVQTLDILLKYWISRYQNFNGCHMADSM
ncbi:hypothetical protein M8C21_016965 [Ambrosia artemisiifolia]|uniref:Uncharacterized protein n=1 Tax=Ambrosia artemisiifolia TaxID=4212 RepID=A0AAD5D295_AMBAR|nr:hypothetical protein M8C21_016965 [Ambrosia artemisiifolia]